MVGVLVACAAMGPAHGQVPGGLRDLPGTALPGRGLPDLTEPLPERGEVLDPVERTLRSTRPEALLEARELRLRALVRHNRDILEADPTGWPVMRGEILAVSPSAGALTRAREAGFTVVRESRVEDLGFSIFVLSPPRGRTTRQGLELLRRLDPQGSYEFNHVLEPAGAAALPTIAPAAAAAPATRARIGLIDTGADVASPALRGAAVEQRAFGAAQPRPAPHGTAVASLLVGRSGAFAGAAPGATLYVADVFGPRGVGGAAENVALALAWMARNRVPVVNISLVGPPNAALAAAVRSVTARGHLVVAAVGNDGPAAPPAHPAALPGVVGVTGLNARSQPLPEAGRGDQVDFAAPGADMAAADGGGFVVVRGTSFAAPLVAGLLARRLSRPDPAAARAAVDWLTAAAKDLGPRGRDPTYGAGAVAADLRTAPRAVGARRRLTR